MHCSEIQELLSAYHDGELSEGNRLRLSAHFDECSLCAKKLAEFEKISGIASSLFTPEPPAHLWSQLAAQLPQEPSVALPDTEPVSPLGRGPLHRSKLFSLAATALVAITIGWFAYQSWLGDEGDGSFTAEFGQFLEQFQRDPDAAQQLLLAKYENQFVHPEQAIERVGYRPVVADGLPEGYTVVSTYVMKMPCCTCVQCLCKRADGSMIAIFEHDDENTDEWFGDRAARTKECHGKRCSLVELDTRFAASWQRDQRHITIVGLRDTSELAQFVAWFEGQDQVQL